MVAHHLPKVGVAGSIPVVGSGYSFLPSVKGVGYLIALHDVGTDFSLKHMQQIVMTKDSLRQN